MTNDNQPTTICVECRHRIISKVVSPEYDKCFQHPWMDYSTGEAAFGYCTTHNTDGDCPNYAPIPAGSDPADMDELNAAVEAGEA